MVIVALPSGELGLGRVGQGCLTDVVTEKHRLLNSV